MFTCIHIHSHAYKYKEYIVIHSKNTYFLYKEHLQKLAVIVDISVTFTDTNLAIKKIASSQK